MTESTAEARNTGSASPAGAPRTPSRWNWRNWPVLAKLIAVLLIPTTVALVVGVLRVVDEASGVPAYTQVSRMIEVQQQLSGLIGAVQRERALATTYAASGREGVPVELNQQFADVDNRAGTVRSAADQVPDLAATGYRPVLDQLGALGPLRQRVTVGNAPVNELVSEYGAVIDPLVAWDAGLLRQLDDAAVADDAAAVHALVSTREQIGRQQAIIAAALHEDEIGPVAIDDVRAAAVRLGTDQESFRTALDPAERADLTVRVAGDAELARQRMMQLVLDRGARGESLDDIPPAEWQARSEAASAEVGAVEDMLRSRIDNTAQSLRDEARSTAGWNAVILMFALALGVLVGILMARAMLRPLGVLRRTALDVAGRRLPDAVSRIRGGDYGADAVEPVPVHTREEIGQVARAFDEVQRQAVRLAAEQARMRENVNDIFVNLSRRSQSLVERQLQLIDRLESGEQDPEQLDNLFQLDHLATRMRRNSENLLVLAGTEGAKRASRPVRLVDVLRASVSEVEQYQRLALHQPPSALVLGRTASDLVHLLAELLDNAAQFSPPDTQVVVSGSFGSDGAVRIEVLDRGVGMTEAELAEANDRLSSTPTVDASVSRRMGLFVVGRLAVRHGIVVRLRRGDDSIGICAMVTIPARLVRPVSDGPGGPESRATAAVGGAVRGALPAGGAAAPDLGGNLGGGRGGDRGSPPPAPGPGADRVLGDIFTPQADPPPNGTGAPSTNGNGQHAPPQPAPAEEPAPRDQGPPRDQDPPRGPGAPRDQGPPREPERADPRESERADDGTPQRPGTPAAGPVTGERPRPAGQVPTERGEQAGQQGHPPDGEPGGRQQGESGGAQAGPQRLPQRSGPREQRSPLHPPGPQRTGPGPRPQTPLPRRIGRRPEGAETAQSRSTPPGAPATPPGPPATSPEMPPATSGGDLFQPSGPPAEPPAQSRQEPPPEPAGEEAADPRGEEGMGASTPIFDDVATSWFRDRHVMPVRWADAHHGHQEAGPDASAAGGEPERGRAGTGPAASATPSVAETQDDVREAGRQDLDGGARESGAREAGAPEAGATGNGPETDVRQRRFPGIEVRERRFPLAGLPETAGRDGAAEADAEVGVPEADHPEAEHSEAEYSRAGRTEAQYPEAQYPDAEDPQVAYPEVDVPEAEDPEADVSEVDVLEADVLEADVLDADVLETGIPETGAPETGAPWADGREAEVPEVSGWDAHSPGADVQEPEPAEARDAVPAVWSAGEEPASDGPRTPHWGDADAGWRAAEALSTPSSAGVTPAGLPRRKPRALLVPGTAGGPEETGGGGPTRSAESVRGRLSSYQQGIREGRQVRRNLSQRTGRPGEPDGIHHETQEETK